MICRLRGYELKIVGDPAIGPLMRHRLAELGAETIICSRPSPVCGYQLARLNRLDELRAEYPCHYISQQYSNPDNAASYSLVAELLTETLGSIDCLVGAVGSGGSTGGTASFLRLVTPELRLVGMDTPGSAIFGYADRPRLLRGLGNSLLPPTSGTICTTRVHWVGPAEAFLATRALHATHCLFMGPTSGAAFLVAHWYAASHPDEIVVALLADKGYRYEETVYSDGWLREQGLLRNRLPTRPTIVGHPDEVALPSQVRAGDAAMGRRLGQHGLAVPDACLRAWVVWELRHERHPASSPKFPQSASDQPADCAMTR